MEELKVELERAQAAKPSCSSCTRHLPTCFWAIFTSGGFRRTLQLMESQEECVRLRSQLPCAPLQLAVCAPAVLIISVLCLLCVFRAPGRAEVVAVC